MLDFIEQTLKNEISKKDENIQKQVKAELLKIFENMLQQLKKVPNKMKEENETDRLV